MQSLLKNRKQNNTTQYVTIIPQKFYKYIYFFAADWKYGAVE